MHRRKRKGAGSNLFTEKTFRRNSEVIKGEANSNTHTAWEATCDFSTFVCGCVCARGAYVRASVLNMYSCECHQNLDLQCQHNATKTDSAGSFAL